jgi:hypothetical protein
MTCQLDFNESASDCTACHLAQVLQDIYGGIKLFCAAEHAGTNRLVTSHTARRTSCQLLLPTLLQTLSIGCMIQLVCICRPVALQAENM